MQTRIYTYAHLFIMLVDIYRRMQTDERTGTRAHRGDNNTCFASVQRPAGN